MARVWNRVAGAAAGVAALLVVYSCSDSTGPDQAGAPAQVDIVSGNGQQGTVGKALPSALVVRVVDDEGRPVAGQTVNFVVTAGGGTVFAGSASTNSQGLVQEIWTLGTVAGEVQRLEARAVNNTTGAPIVFAAFTATAVADVPAAVQITTQPGTPARVRATLAPQPVVRLVDRYGNVVRNAGVTVAATIAGGSRTLQGTTGVATDANGVAAFTNLAILGQVGTLAITFTSAGLTAAPSTDIVLQAGDPALITKVSADAQSAAAGSAVASAPSIKVTDADGNPVIGAAVTFAVGSGGGQVTGGAAVTDAEGVATVGSWTVGTTTGTNTLTASIGGLATTFTATATPGAAVLAILQAPSTTASSGVPLAQQPRIRLQDQYGNEIHEPGVTVTAEIVEGPGGLTVSGATATTDADGIATFTSLTLTGVVGTVRLRFATPDGDPVAAPNISLTAGNPGFIFKTAGDNQSAEVRKAVAVAPAVRVADANGNNAAGVTVHFQVATGDGSVTGADAVTNAQGIATVGSWTLGPRVGANTLTATVGGLSTTFNASSFISWQVQILSPAEGQVVGDELSVVVRITSGFEAGTVKASVEGHEADLADNHDGTWSGSLDIADVGGAQRTLIVLATDAYGNTNGKGAQFVHGGDHAPSLSVTSPQNGDVAPNFNARATCTDDSGSCTIVVSVRSPGLFREIGRAANAIDVQVGVVQRGNGAEIVFEARDNISQVTTETRTVFVEDSERLTQVDRVGGTITDVTSDRISFVKDAYDIGLGLKSGPAAIHTRGTGADETVAGPNTVQPDLYLTPAGAIFASPDTRNGHEWKAGALIDLGSILGLTLRTAGPYAIWGRRDGSALILRDLLIGTNTTISTIAARGELGTNGVVAYEGFRRTPGDYQIFRYENGVTTQLTDGSDCHRGPRTDGILIAYLRETPCEVADRTYQLMLYDGTKEVALTAVSASAFDYLVAYGWVAFIPGESGFHEIWVRSPAGVVSRALTVGGFGAFLQALGPNGEIVYGANARRYVATPDGSKNTEIGTNLGKPFWVGNELYIAIGGTLFRAAY